QNAGITMAGLLILATWPPSPDKFFEIAAPATMLVVMGLIAIHLERAFPESPGGLGGDSPPTLQSPFSRRRFGLAYFWSGHAQLAGGLLLLLAAFLAGDWLYTGWFESIYREWGSGPSPMVGNGELVWL